jgi:predicted nucleotidyltransferase
MSSTPMSRTSQRSPELNSNSVMPLNKPMTNADLDPGEAIEGHYLETTQGLFFAAKGFVHPPDRIVAILRYLPDPARGEREKGGWRYRRVYGFAEQEALLQEKYPQFLSFDPVCRSVLQSVPRQHLKRVYDPRDGLQELRIRKELDPVEREALAFARLLQEEASVPGASLGLSGSLLIGLHTPHSDLDLMVYGTLACWAVHEALSRLAGTAASGVSRLDDKGLAELYAARVKDTRLPFADFVRTERRKIIQGQYRGRTYSMRFVKAPAEVEEKYGDRQYTPLGRAGIEAAVADAGEAIFTPCVYRVADVRFVEGLEVEGVEEVVSFRSRFCEQAREGDKIAAFGTLERVQARGGRAWHRLLLGSHPEDYIVPR